MTVESVKTSESIRERLSRRARIYEERTGNWLPINVLAKSVEIGSAALFIDATLENANPRYGMIIAGVALAATITDRATGGLRGYGVDQE